MLPTMDRPTLDNWMRPPHPFWSFRHVRELIPTARIRHGHHVHDQVHQRRPYVRFR